MQAYEQAVFLSYAWGGEREEIVNRIDKALQGRGIKITRDNQDTNFSHLYKTFQTRLRGKPQSLNAETKTVRPLKQTAGNLGKMFLLQTGVLPWEKFMLVAM
jgi:hypothetical protein